MYARALIILSIVILGTSCTYRDPSIDLLEGELRWMEDQLFMLEDELETKCAELASCRTADQGTLAPTPAVTTDPRNYTIISDEIVRPEPEPSVDLPPLDALPMQFPMDGESSGGQEPSINLPPSASDDQDSGYSLVEPSIELPRSEPATEPESNSAPYRIVEPSVELPPTSDEPATPTPAEPSPLQPQDSPLPLPGDLNSSPPDVQPPTSSIRSNEVRLQSFSWEEPRATVADPPAIDAHVTHVVAQAEITTAYDFDDKPTDPGLLVIIEPRNSDGTYVALAGELSLVVLDGNQQGGAARVARWDFDAAAARRRIRSSSRGNGIHLVLPWHGTPPESDDLHLFVRYSTVEGRLLEADLLLEKGRSSERWNVTRRNAVSWSSTSPKQGVRIPTSPIKTTPMEMLPAIDPSELKLRPMPTATTQRRDPSGNIATAAYQTPVNNGVALATVPIPTEAITAGSPEQNHSTTATAVEMPAVRNIRRPEWKPYR